VYLDSDPLLELDETDDPPDLLPDPEPLLELDEPPDLLPDPEDPVLEDPPDLLPDPLL